MLKTEDRATIISYLSTSASDAVIIEAFENARRENSHALITLVNYQNEMRSLKARKDTSTKEEQSPPVATELITPLVSDVLMPSKLTAVGKELIDVLKRADKPMVLADIAKAAHRSITQARPQLAVAVKRKLVVQLRTDLFEAAK